MYITVESENGTVKVTGHVRGNQDREIIIAPGIKKEVGKLTDDICSEIEYILRKW